MGQQQSTTNHSKAIAIMRNPLNEQKVGIVTFHQTQNGVTIDGQIHLQGLEDGYHGFHIHKFGDDSDGCSSMGPHFDDDIRPHVHGDLNQSFRHWGDLGNVKSLNGFLRFNLLCKTISLSLGPRCIIGRGLVLHRDEDDLGLGGDRESLKTGNSGQRIACGAIVLTA